MLSKKYGDMIKLLANEFIKVGNIKENNWLDVPEDSELKRIVHSLEQREQYGMSYHQANLALLIAKQTLNGTGNEECRITQISTGS